MKKLLLSLFICSLGFSISSYSQIVENVDYSIDGDKIYITYDISYYEDGKKYNVDLKFVDNNGRIIIPKTVEGDIGSVYGGRNRKITWAVLQDMQEMSGEYKAIVTINEKETEKQNTQKHSFLFCPNLPWAFFGVKYAYIGKAGCYISGASDFGLMDETCHVTGGLALSVAQSTNIYFGGGMEIFWAEPLVESGVILKFKSITIDLGGGLNIFDTYYSYGKIGAGFSF
jgi:hypothetical protein